MNATQCPKCNAELPARGRFCLECGCDLYQAAVRRPPFRWGSALILLAVVGGILALVVLGSTGWGFRRRPELPPEERVVRDLTRELLQLAASGSHGEVVRRFYRPNTQEFLRLDAALQEVVRGRGAPGLNIFRAHCMDDLDEARKFVERHGTEHPAYVVGVLAALTFQDGALRATLGGTPLGAQRAEDFAAWHLSLAFHSVDVKGSEIGDARWRDGAGGERLLAVAVRYPEPPRLVPGVVDPTALAWRYTEDGSWALAFGSALGLDEVLAFLLKVKL
ncbi:MAG TPA: zinc ribbon domain-containing protein [Planctomycetota bacterium]|nr:zinc ribbon domain-containing protein [Planctomycetota bacterium]